MLICNQLQAWNETTFLLEIIHVPLNQKRTVFITLVNSRKPKFLSCNSIMNSVNQAHIMRRTPKKQQWPTRKALKFDLAWRKGVEVVPSLLRGKGLGAAYGHGKQLGTACLSAGMSVFARRRNMRNVLWLWTCGRYRRPPWPGESY